MKYIYYNLNREIRGDFSHNTFRRLTSLYFTQFSGFVLTLIVEGLVSAALEILP